MTWLGIRSAIWAIAALVLCMPSVSIGGTPLASVPTVGPVSGWESPHQAAFLARMDRLIAFRQQEVPLARATSIYIRQDAEGSPLGGGGNGASPETAYLARHMADVRAILMPRLTSGVAVYFRRGDTFAAAPSNTVQGIGRVTVGGWTLSSYEDPGQPSERKPRLLGFRQLPVSAWTWIAPNVVEFAGDGVSTWWVRGRRATSDVAHGYRAEPYVKEATIAAVMTTPRSFASDGNVLRVNLGPIGSEDDLETLELACARGAGVLIGNVDDVRIDSLILEGWGMDVAEDGNGAIRTEVVGTNVLLITNCEWGWTAYHGMMHAVNEAPGGIVTMSGCTFGYHMNRVQESGGSGDGAVSYNFRGGNEFIVAECVGFGGGLQRIGVNGASSSIQGSPIYMHTGGTTPIGVLVRRGCRFVPLSATRCRYLDYASSNDSVVTLNGERASVPADPLDVRYYRAFVMDEVAEIDGGMNSGGWRAVDINCRIKLIGRGGGGLIYLYGVGGDRYCGWSINRDTEIAVSPIFTSYMFGSQTNVPHLHAFVNARFRITGAGAGTPNDFFSFEVEAARLQQAGMWNCIISNETGKTGCQLKYPNQGASWPNGGGMTSCAVYGFHPNQYSSSAGWVTLSQPATYATRGDTRNLIPGSIASAASGVPQLEYDITRALRRSTSSIGPLEARPTCDADVNRDGFVDFFDYLDFVAILSMSEPTADFNRDSNVDFFDYLDFVAAFSIGCD
jgi:hypothetical protein